MKKVLLYWSNICVLHKQEMNHIEQVKEALRQQGIDLVVRCFGLGYPEKMSAYLQREDAQWPDIIVSTDLEVFENQRLFARLAPELHELRRAFPLKAAFAGTDLDRHPSLVPFAVIPQMLYSNQPLADGELSVRAAIAAGKRLAFGGINNSAARCVLKTAWSQWGQEAAQQLLENGRITDMPIQAFQLVRMGQEELAMVPSLYALRADGQERFAAVPAEGAIALPSYVCARKTVTAALAQEILQALLSEAFCRFLVQAGDLVCPLAQGAVHQRLEQAKFLYPDQQWFEQVTPEAFEQFYEAVYQAKRLA